MVILLNGLAFAASLVLTVVYANLGHASVHMDLLTAIIWSFNAGIWFTNWLITTLNRL